MRKKSYTEEQLKIVRNYYPKGRWDIILPAFPHKTKADIRAIARMNGIRRDREFLKDLDLTGQRFFDLTALRPEIEGNKTNWICRCECGKECIVTVYALMNGATKSCGCRRHRPARNVKDYTGTKYGLLTAVERLPHYRNNETYYRCICECGTEKIASASNLNTGHVRTCGSKIHTKKQFDFLNREKDDTEKTYSVYRHISPKGKSYIGITRQRPERRFQNGNGYKTQKSFYRAIEKYGWDKFKHEILEEGLTEKEACEKESYYIGFYNSFSPNGYNTREGGTSGRNKVTPVIQYYNGVPVNFFDGLVQASETLKVAQKTIHIHCGEANAIGGYYFEQLDPIAPYDIEDKMWELRDEAHYVFQDIIAKDVKEQVLQRNKRCSKPVNKYTLDGKYICTYESLIQARQSIPNSDGQGICAAVNPKRQGETAYGYMWKYDDGNQSDIDHVKYKAQRAVLKVDNLSGNVIEEYTSITKAAKSLNVSLEKIRSECNGEEKHFDGFFLKYKWPKAENS